MKFYVATSGALFGLLAAVHVARLVVEGAHPLADPFFVVSTLLALGMSGWAAYLLFSGLSKTSPGDRP